MSEERVNAARTPVTIDVYSRAGIIAWRTAFGKAPEKAQLGVLWSQYMVETHGTECFNWNIGNVKWTPGCGFNYHCLGGTWECYPHEEAQRYIKRGEAVQSTKPAHVKAAGPSRTPVIFQPPHPFTRFRAYPSLEVSMPAHLKLLRERFDQAWPYLESGDARGFAYALKQQRYYTADENIYAKRMDEFFTVWTRSKAFDKALQALGPDPAPPTPRVLDFPIVRPRVPLMREDGTPLDPDVPDDVS